MPPGVCQEGGAPFHVTFSVLIARRAPQASDTVVEAFEIPSEASTSELNSLMAWFKAASDAVGSEGFEHGDPR